jgi:hypothetical protein
MRRQNEGARRDDSKFMHFPHSSKPIRAFLLR